jgi:hypothetical protein
MSRSGVGTSAEKGPNLHENLAELVLPASIGATAPIVIAGSILHQFFVLGAEQDRAAVSWCVL